MPRRRFKQLDLDDWKTTRERAQLEPAQRGALTRVKNRETAAWNALLMGATSFFDAVQPHAKRMGMWSELWFPVPGDPAAPERARMAATAMRDRAARGQSSISDHAFLIATAQWLDEYAATLERARGARARASDVQEKFEQMLKAWTRAWWGHTRNRSGQPALF